jgi:fatty acid desaturase
MSRNDRRLERVRAALRPHLPELSRRRPLLYWTDLLITSAVGWSYLVLGAAVAAGLVVELPGAARACLSAVLFVVAVVSLYRASSFMHEVAHVRTTMPVFASAWDLLIGVPLLFPSLLYSGVHDTHHDHRVFGTEGDPEYVPHDEHDLAHQLLSLALFAATPALLLFRWAIVTPLSCLHPRARRFAVERLSSFSGNPAYRRPMPVGAESRRWLVTEAACFAWSAALITLVVTGVIAPLSAVFAVLVSSCVALLHGARSFATHRFGGHGAQRTVEEQFLDSINVTGHPLWTELWAPAGLRYHALHHLAPRLPYHALSQAHRLLMESLPDDDVYRDVTFRSVREVFDRDRRRRAEGTLPSAITRACAGLPA